MRFDQIPRQRGRESPAKSRKFPRFAKSFQDTYTITARGVERYDRLVRSRAYSILNIDLMVPN